MSKIKNSIVAVDHVSFYYRTEAVLEDVTFDIQKGDYVGIVGSNGSGKTTLLKIILGLLSAKKGSVRLFGEELSHFHNWRKIGYVPQNVFRGDLGFPATVEEVVGSGYSKPSEKGISFPKKKEKVEAALARAGIEYTLKKRIGELSGGERQRVFIARALVSDPELLVLDEPTTGIDVATEQKFYRFLEELNNEGMTILLVSHDLEVIARQVKTVLCLNRKLVCFGKPESLEKPEILKAMYGSDKHVLRHEHDHITV